MSTIRRVSLLVLVATLFAMGSAVAQMTPETAVGPVDTPAIRAPLSNQDVTFIRTAAELNMAQIMAGQIAMQHGSTPAVREFARRMVINHANVESLMLNVAARRGVALPIQPDQDHKSTIFRLGNNLHGKSFDNKYIEAQIDDHKAMITLFEDEATKGKEASFRALATRLLPRLRENLAAAERLKATDGQTSGLPPMREGR